MFRGKRVFISGGAGVIGRELVDKLSKAGAELFIGDLKPRPSDWPSTIRYRQGDLNTIAPEELQQYAPNVFFHLAATFERSTESYDFWQENDLHNTRLSHYLMDALKDVQQLERVVFASSYLIYNPELYQFDEPAVTARPLLESDPIYPRNLCGMAKLSHEMELQFLSEHSRAGYSTVSARIYRVYGKDSRDIVSRWIRALLKGETLQVYRKEGMFDYIYAGDVAEGLFRLAMSDQQGIVNLGNGRARRVEEVLQVLLEHFPDMKVVQGFSDIPYEASEADMSRFQQWTGWRPERNLEDTIPELIEHYRNSSLQLAEKQVSDRSILISSVSKKVPLIHSVRQAAEKLGSSCSVIGADSNAACIGQYFVDKFWYMPRLDELSLSELLLYCEVNQIRSIIPTRDGELSYFSAHQAELAAQGISVLVSNPEVVQRCIDKLAFYEFGKQAGFPVIPTTDSIGQLRTESYVVKERFGAGALHIAIDVSEEVAQRHARQLEHPIYQPYIEGVEVSADLYVDRKGKCKGVILRRRELIVNGESQVTATFRNDEIERLCTSFAERLGIYGHAVMQLFIDDRGKYHIIECNARLGGASRLSLESGLDSIYWFLLESQGTNLNEYPFIRSAQEKRLIRYAQDVIQ